MDAHYSNIAQLACAQGRNGCLHDEGLIPVCNTDWSTVDLLPDRLEVGRFIPVTRMRIVTLTTPINFTLRNYVIKTKFPHVRMIARDLRTGVQ